MRTTPSQSKPAPLLRWILLVAIAVALALFDIIIILNRPVQPHRVNPSANTIRVLFIGNSYTAVNNLPGLLMELAAREPKPIDAEAVVVGGYRLADHWAQGNALAAIQRGHWDYVVLQEQSTLGSGVVIDGIDQIADPTLFHQYVRKFNTEIQKAGAKTILYLTWARRNAPQNQSHLTNAYMTIARELNLTVAPVGPAWQQLITTAPNLNLYQDDGSHPDAAGSYLAACVFYATLYHKSPQGLPSHLANQLVDSAGETLSADITLQAADATLLQQIAWQTVSAVP